MKPNKCYRYIATWYALIVFDKYGIQINLDYYLETLFNIDISKYFPLQKEHMTHGTNFIKVKALPYNNFYLHSSRLNFGRSIEDSTNAKEKNWINIYDVSSITETII